MSRFYRLYIHLDPTPPCLQTYTFEYPIFKRRILLIDPPSIISSIFVCSRFFPLLSQIFVVTSVKRRLEKCERTQFGNPPPWHVYVIYGWPLIKSLNLRPLSPYSIKFYREGFEVTNQFGPGVCNVQQRFSVCRLTLYVIDLSAVKSPRGLDRAFLVGVSRPPSGSPPP